MGIVRKKCIVAGCKNHTDGGMFNGDMCMPCYHAITTGDTNSPTDAFWNRINIENRLIEIPSWDMLFMKHVYLIATKSKDTKTKIGAIIVRDRIIISEGYNGMAMGVNDNILTRYERPEKYFWMSHAERNSIFNCARNGIKTEGATVYTQGLPCSDCADAIINSRIKEVIVHYEWEHLWDNISHNKWEESAKRSKAKFIESGVNYKYFSGKMDCKTLIDGKVYNI